MKALTKTKDGLILAEKDFSAPEGESLVRVLISGICNTDIEIVKGYAGFHGTIGHEFVGLVEESPDVPGLIGKRVLGEINVGCLKCGWCRENDSRHCPGRTVLGILGRDGSHAEYLSLPARNLIEVPDEISNERAVFAEPFAAALGITEQVPIRPETRVAVIGDGKLGILCAWALATKTQHLFLIGRHPNKLRIGELGNAEGVLLEDAGKFGRDFDVVVEASGSESGFETALGLVRPRGKVVLKSTFQGKSVWEAWRVVVDEITIVGSRCGKFRPVIDLIRNPAFPLEKLIAEEFALTDGIKAMDHASRRGALKVILRP
ncbi:MAG: alcohol dehydrogenase catalytic domain-containing protein [Acidobacteriota bacterium]|nr:alcohol dehydrogenase catalytic domain-containing protein [Acidobacteriota bacterium]MDH3528304.1 alcohol dehydrogenase catalytic domain-containing protein [Acidobacteriota bacterium]